jgi:hypothetical protein
MIVLVDRRWEIDRSLPPAMIRPVATCKIGSPAGPPQSRVPLFMSRKLMGIILLVALLATFSAQAEPRKKGGSRPRARSRKTESSLTLVPPPSSILDPPSPPVTAAPPPTSPESAAPSADSPPDADADRPRISLLPLILLGVEPLLESRVFQQSEGMQDLEYRAIGYPSVALTGELYPLSNVKAKFWRGFGVNFQFAHAFGFESDSARLAPLEARNTPPADTSFMRYAAGLRYRIHTNPESETPFVFGISASLRRWHFTFAPELPLGPDLEVPTANYRMVRFGFDAAVEVRRVTFYAAAHYLHGFSILAPNTRELDAVTAPDLARPPGMGGELRGAVGVRLARWVELRLSVEYAIMAFRLKPLQEGGSPDRVIDSYLSAGLGPYVSF